PRPSTGCNPAPRRASNLRKESFMRSIWPTLLAALCFCTSARAAVVINEIFYHAPEDLDDLQWIELYNTDDQPIDLSGWYFGKSPGYVIPKNTTIAAKGFL